MFSFYLMSLIIRQINSLQKTTIQIVINSQLIPKVVYNKSKINKYLKQLSIALKMFSPVPMLQMGMSRNRVAARSIFASNTFTSITRPFSPPWLLLSSVSIENRLFLQSFTT